MAENSAVATVQGEQPPTVGEKCLKAWTMLKGWVPAYPLPRGITRAGLDGALTDANAALLPADYEAFNVIMDRLFSFAETFSVKDAGIRDAMRFYRETLDDVPPDLLAKAVDHTVRTYKYGHRLPPPGDLREVIQADLDERHSARRRIESAMCFGRCDDEVRRAPTQAEKDRVAKIVAETKRSLSA